MRAPVQDIVLVHVLDRAENLLKHVEHTLLAQRLLLLRQQLRKSPANTQSVCCIYKNVVNDVVVQVRSHKRTTVILFQQETFTMNIMLSKYSLISSAMNRTAYNTHSLRKQYYLRRRIPVVKREYTYICTCVYVCASFDRARGLIGRDTFKR